MSAPSPNRRGRKMSETTASWIALKATHGVRAKAEDSAVGLPHYLTILFLRSQAIENALKSNLLIRDVTEDSFHIQSL